MPKMKTKSSAKKRFKITGTGKIKIGKGYRRHLLTKKSRKLKRHMRQTGYICAADHAGVMRLLPYGFK
jgi:large subunit ribosomal protein L35